MFDHEQKIMIDRIVKELEENNFAIFAVLVYQPLRGM